MTLKRSAIVLVLAGLASFLLAQTKSATSIVTDQARILITTTPVHQYVSTTAIQTPTNGTLLTTFPLPASWSPVFNAATGEQNLSVYRNGLIQFTPGDFTMGSSNGLPAVVFVTTPQVGDVLQFRILQ